MKKFATFCIYFLFIPLLFSQVPDKISYQAVIRNSNGTLVVKSNVGIKISLIKGSINEQAVFSESFMVTSNSNGLINLEIGKGNLLSGNFSQIDWANGPFFIKTETDPLGGSNYSISGISELLSVPYAMISKSTLSVPYDFNLSEIGNMEIYPEQTQNINFQISSYMYDHEDVKISVIGLPSSITYKLSNSILNIKNRVNSSTLTLSAASNLIDDNSTYKINIRAITKNGKQKDYYFNLKAISNYTRFLGVYNVSDTIVDQAGSSRYYKDTIRYGGGNKIIFNGYSLDYSQTYLSGKFANYNSNDIDIPLQGNDKSYDPTIIGKGKWLGYGFEILYTRKINGIVENRRAYYNKIAD